VIVHVDGKFGGHDLAFGDSSTSKEPRDPIAAAAALALVLALIARTAAFQEGEAFRKLVSQAGQTGDGLARLPQLVGEDLAQQWPMALGAVALSSQTRRKTLISVSEKPMSCSFWIHRCA